MPPRQAGELVCITRAFGAPYHCFARDVIGCGFQSFESFELLIRLLFCGIRPYASELLDHPFLAAVDAEKAAGAVRSSPFFGNTVLGAPVALPELSQSGPGLGLQTEFEQTATDDLATIQNNSEALVVEVLRERFEAGTVYTYISDILVALNPVDPVGGYGPEVADNYLIHAAPCTTPHIYAMALKAFGGMVVEGESQASR